MPSDAAPEAQQSESPVKKEKSAGNRTRDKKRDSPEKEVQPYLEAIEGLEHASLLKQSGAELVMTGFRFGGHTAVLCGLPDGAGGPGWDI